MLDDANSEVKEMQKMIDRCNADFDCGCVKLSMDKIEAVAFCNFKQSKKLMNGYS